MMYKKIPQSLIEGKESNEQMARKDNTEKYLMDMIQRRQLHFLGHLNLYKRVDMLLQLENTTQQRQR